MSGKILAGRHTGRLLVVAASLACLLAGCSSSKPNPSNGSRAGKGSRVLDAVVVGREYDPPGSGGTSFGSSGAYYLDFEAREGEATAHYHFAVTRAQYNRFVEGTHVQLALIDDQLRDIRLVP